ncbi:hypothetical protein GCM10025868_00560 [Angustibacter aerolatus]|uniref:B12-binding domain-containing protein n=1 Tax=Angustibacter aerolatus TaxID=1162965 RepID=A0ABQ6J9F7_9ACTN|nr:hypothetical protein GCM10025868_00560 [Angustibacter aerolatus]
MRVVGEPVRPRRDAAPFVLQSAETMKAAVAHLEPHIEGAGDVGANGRRKGKATIVLATVKGDVHDIGKNLVDIILTNNGYDVVNIGIKQPVGEILRAAEEHEADAIGMSGLLVKSTVVMKENLEEPERPGHRREHAGAARRRGAHPGVRRGRPSLGVPGAGALRPRRLRGAAAHGRHREGQGRPVAQRRAGAARACAGGGCAAAPRAPTRPASRWPSTPAGPTSQPTSRCRCRRSGAPGWSRASPWPTTPPTSTSAPRSSASGG